MKLPDYPVSGEPVPASWGRQVVDYLRSITPRSAPGHRVNITSNGTTHAADPVRRRRQREHGFNGRIWIAATGQWMDDYDPQGKPWVKIVRGNPAYTISSEDSGPGQPHNPNEEWWPVNEINGEIRSYL